jgi:hypothetical protein
MRVIMDIDGIVYVDSKKVSTKVSVDEFLSSRIAQEHPRAAEMVRRRITAIDKFKTMSAYDRSVLQSRIHEGYLLSNTAMEEKSDATMEDFRVWIRWQKGDELVGEMHEIVDLLNNKKPEVDDELKQTIKYGEYWLDPCLDLRMQEEARLCGIEMPLTSLGQIDWSKSKISMDPGPFDLMIFNLRLDNVSRLVDY